MPTTSQVERTLEEMTSKSRRKPEKNIHLVANQRLEAAAWAKCLQQIDASSSQVSYVEAAQKMASTSDEPKVLVPQSKS